MRAGIAPLTATLVACSLFGCGGSKPTEDWSGAKAGARADENKQQPRPAKPDRLKPSVNAGTLWLEYGENEARADDEYTDRRITVGGDVYSVVKHGDGYEVRFTVLAHEGPGNSQYGAVARFPASERDSVAKLRELQMCYLQGRCLGKASGPRNGYTVVIEDCKIILEPKY